jgi:hypothetical protein
MNTLDLLGELYRLGVTLVIGGGHIRARAARGSLTPELCRHLAEQKEVIIDLLGDGRFPDEMAPAVLRIPCDVPNDTHSIRLCIDAQRFDACDTTPAGNL